MLIVLTAMLLIGTPTAILGASFAGHPHDGYSAFQNDTLKMRKPDPAVAQWPLVGPRVYTLWNSAAEDLPGLIRVNKALLLGTGFLFAGIPAAGVLAFVVLLVGIVQLPALIVTLPAIGYLCWAGDAPETSGLHSPWVRTTRSRRSPG